MKTYDSLADFRNDLWTAIVPDYLKEMQRRVILIPSALGTAETLLIELYSQRATIAPETLDIVAGGLAMFERDRFLTIGQDGSAGRMRLAVLRDRGEPSPEGMPWPDPSDDPVFE